jgi:hypothetical protein
MKFVLRLLARQFPNFSARIFKVLYFWMDGFYKRTEFCKICGFPIRRDWNKHTFWAEAEVLNLDRKGYYVYPICKHCRNTKTWDKIFEAYKNYWHDLADWSTYPGFTWKDIETALNRDRKVNGSNGDIKFWKKTIERSYKSEEREECEYCGFKPGKVMPEVVKAAEELSKKYKGIQVLKTETRISIKFIKTNGKRQKKQRQKVILLPGKTEC